MIRAIKYTLIIEMCVCVCVCLCVCERTFWRTSIQTGIFSNHSFMMSTMTNIIYVFACSGNNTSRLPGSCDITSNVFHNFIIHESFQCTCVLACMQPFQHTHTYIQNGTFQQFMHDDTMEMLIMFLHVLETTHHICLGHAKS